MKKFANGFSRVCGLIVAASLSFTAVFAEAGTGLTKSANMASTNGAEKTTVSDKSTSMTREQMLLHIREANAIAKEWKGFGHHPFGAILVGPDNQTVLMRQGNLSVVRHAETELARRAAEAFSPEYLAKCTLVTTMEPCVMCSGNIYFANIGGVVYGATEETLGKLTGTSQMNPTMHLPCRQVFAAGQKSIQVDGPFPELEAELLEPHKGFWK